MFRSALVLLTIVAVLWHALAGCCAHHDHAAAAGEANNCGCHSHASDSEAAKHSHASDHAKHEDEGDALAHLGRPHDPSSDACGERCSFPQPEGSGVSLLKHSLAACDLTFLVATLDESSNVPPAEQESGFDAPPPGPVGHALRRHLAFGVLLI
jgi:hypothetical protein